MSKESEVSEVTLFRGNFLFWVFYSWVASNFFFLNWTWSQMPFVKKEWSDFMWRFWSGKGKIAIQAFLVQKVWLEMKGLTLLTLSEMSDPTFLTLGSVSPFTFVSPWLQELNVPRDRHTHTDTWQPPCWIIVRHGIVHSVVDKKLSPPQAVLSILAQNIAYF